MVDALFEQLGPGRFHPTEFARGPWSPDALHGGPVALLAAREAERVLVASQSDAHLPVRMTLDLERPVPLETLSVEASVRRPGRKVQLAEVTITDASGQRVATAEIQAIRRQRVEFPEDVSRFDDAPIPPPPSEASSFAGWGFPVSDIAYHQDATEHRVIRGSLGSPGPVIDWIELIVPVVADEEPSAFQRVAAAADFLNGVSWVLSGADWIFINPDLTITIHRLPVGNRIAVDAVTRLGDDGIGTAEADLFDEQGRIGRAVQTLLVEPR